MKGLSMAFCLSADESVEDGIKRIVNEEISQTIKKIDNSRLKRTEAIHEVRKHCKKIRSVLRLVRPQFEKTYQFENVWFRDTAKGLAELRDAAALLETYDSLLGKFSHQVDRRAFATVRRALTLRQKRIIEKTGNLNQKLKKLRARMVKADKRLPDWELNGENINAGVVGTYRRTRKTMVSAYHDPTAENFHEWRKQAKYHNHHMRLLLELWKPVIGSLSKETKELSDLLGDDHNPAVLYKTLLKFPSEYGQKRDIQVLLGLIDRRSAELRMEAHRIGARIFAEKPRAFGRRFKDYWKAWRTQAKLPSKKLSEEPAVVTAAA
jgi:CHAD domain-containing protein